VNLIEEFEKKNPCPIHCFFAFKEYSFTSAKYKMHIGTKIHSLGLELSSISWLGSNRALLRLDLKNNLDMSKF
jgi:hypothetical protein